MKRPFARCGAAATLAFILVAGCTVPAKDSAVPAKIEVIEEPEWRGLASDEDKDRIARLDEAWTKALYEARSRGFRRAILQEGELLQPGAGLPKPSPSPGPYRCRTLKLGTKGGRGLAFNNYKDFFCYVDVDGPLLTIVKQTGSQRPAGRLFPDKEEGRLIFLGTLTLGTEEAPLPYGKEPDRDMVGVLERVGPLRFRLVIPWPRYESKLDVIELVPVPPEAKTQ